VRLHEAQQGFPVQLLVELAVLIRAELGVGELADQRDTLAAIDTSHPPVPFA
jgi:hypothetical protein